MFVGMMDCTLAYLFIRHLFCMPLFCTSRFFLGTRDSKKKTTRHFCSSRTFRDWRWRGTDRQSHDALIIQVL